MKGKATASYRRIVETTTVIAGASAFNIAASFVRMKLAAVILGPAGVGLIGLFQNLIATAASISSLGIATIGTRKIAEALDDPASRSMAVARKSLAIGAAVLAILGMVVVWLFRVRIASQLLGDPVHAGAIGWLSIGVALTVYAGAQTAYLNGLQRIGDLARLSIASGLLALVAGIGFLWLLGPKGIVLFVLTIPAANFLVGLWLVSRVPVVPSGRILVREMGVEWRGMLRLGLAVVAASASFSLAQLVLRSLVARDLGTDALGHFHAAWTISVTYAGFIFQAMGTDYFPRLAACGTDNERRNRTVGEQAEVLLLLAAPILLAILTLAPWVVKLAYSAEFAESAGLLRWQVLGDLLKLAGWPIGLIFLANGESRKYMAVEIAASATLVVATWLLLPHFGLQSTSLGFVAMNLVYLILALAIASTRNGFAWPAGVRNRLLVVLAIAIAILLLSRWSPAASLAIGVCATLVLAFDGARRMAAMADLGGSLGKIAAQCRRWLGRTG